MIAAKTQQNLIKLILIIILQNCKIQKRLKHFIVKIIKRDENTIYSRNKTKAPLIKMNWIL